MKELTVTSLFIIVSLSSTFANVLKYVPIAKSGKWPPKFCNKLDCPRYTVLETHKEYELRQYSASSWMSTNTAGVDYSKASSTNFMRLFRYISGTNTDKKKIAMTAPVLTMITPGQGPACENNFTMSFFMSPEVKTPPTPTEKGVFPQDMPKMNVYVRSFGGYVRDIKEWIKETIKLGQAIGDTSKYHTEFSYTAGYDSPFRFLNRHNEIWFIAKQQ